MFETLDDALALTGLYAAAGFCLAVIYNILRFFRIAFPRMKKTAAVSDFLFAVAAGLVLFAFSVDNGMGFFRLYYVISAAFGFAVNMLTVGFAVPPLARLAGRMFTAILTAAGKALKIPADYICKISTYFAAKTKKIISNIDEKRRSHLQKRHKMLYNINDHKIDEVHPEGGENRNAIKAKVRKIV